jgi:hypothetical protein
MKLTLSVLRAVTLVAALIFFLMTFFGTFGAVDGQVTWPMIYDQWPDLILASVALALACLVQRRDSRIGKLMF